VTINQNLGLHDVQVFERSIVSNFYEVDAHPCRSIEIFKMGVQPFKIIGESPVPAVDGNFTVSKRGQNKFSSASFEKTDHFITQFSISYFCILFHGCLIKTDTLN